MKHLPYLMLILILPLFTACTDDFQEEQERAPLDEGQLAELYLDFYSPDLLFGKVNVNANNEWKSGWVINKTGELKEIIFQAADQPSEYLVLTTDQLLDIDDQGTVLSDIDDRIALVENHRQAKTNGANYAVKSGEVYFSLHRIDLNYDNTNIAACGMDNSCSEDSEVQGVNVSILAVNEVSISSDKIIETVEWLKQIDHQLN